MSNRKHSYTKTSFQRTRQFLLVFTKKVVQRYRHSMLLTIHRIGMVVIFSFIKMELMFFIFILNSWCLLDFRSIFVGSPTSLIRLILVFGVEHLLPNKKWMILNRSILLIKIPAIESLSSETVIIFNNKVCLQYPSEILNRSRFKWLPLLSSFFLSLFLSLCLRAAVSLSSGKSSLFSWFIMGT